MNINFTVFIILSIISNCAYGEQSEEECGISDEEKLHKKLLCGYSAAITPRKNRNERINVTTEFFLKSIRFDAEKYDLEIFAVTSWRAFMWKDDYLQWNPEDYSGLNKTTFKSEEIWTPKWDLTNSQWDPEFRFDTRCKVTYEGYVICTPHDYSDVACTPSYLKWPRAKVECVLNYASWKNPDDNVDFYPRSNKIYILENFKENGNKNWKLVNSSVERDEGISKESKYRFPEIVYRFELEKYSDAIMTLFAMPAFVLMVLNILSLCIEKKSIERVAIIFLDLLIHSIVMFEISRVLPKNAGDVPHIVIYFRDSIFFTLMILTHHFIVRYLLKKKTEVPFFVAKILSFAKSKGDSLLLFHEFDPSASPSEESEDSTKSESNAQKEWKKIAFLLDRIVLIITFIFYLILIIRYVYL